LDGLRLGADVARQERLTSHGLRQTQGRLSVSRPTSDARAANTPKAATKSPACPARPACP